MKTILRLFVLLGFILVIPTICSFSQVGINTDNSAPNNSAMLDVKSTSKGFLPPRMTHAELNTISNPANGLVVYCTDCGSTGLGALSMFMGGTWFRLSVSCLNPPSSPIATTPDSTCSQIVFHWNAVFSATGYKVNSNNNYDSAFDVGNVLTATAPNCTPSTWYHGYVWAYNDCGHSTPTALSCHTLPGLCIGSSYGGGIIFYFDGSGNGLIAATNDQGNSLQWTSPSTSIPGTSTAIGTGPANTIAIMNGCTNQNIAAWICHLYSGGGYNDWFLPSKDELNLMYLQKSSISGMSGYYYWSSSEDNNNTNNAWIQNFSNGTQNTDINTGTHYVRAIRRFFYIGQSYGGGIIFYLDGTGHGLIAATSDQSSGAWGCEGTSIATSTAFGTGHANTTAIVDSCGDAGAAQICHNLVLNGYSDWFLPSKEELNQMYIHKNEIGGFADYGYWSSPESTAGNAWGQGLGTGPQFEAPKSSTFKVRAVRAF